MNVEINPPSDLPDGLIFRIHVKPISQKYFALSEAKIRCMDFVVPPPQEGRIAIVTDVGSGMRWTRRPRETSAADADGQGVWS
jgi:hypothetical protein